MNMDVVILFLMVDIGFVARSDFMVSLTFIVFDFKGGVGLKVNASCIFNPTLSI